MFLNGDMNGKDGGNGINEMVRKIEVLEKMHKHGCALMGICKEVEFKVSNTVYH